MSVKSLTKKVLEEGRIEYPESQQRLLPMFRGECVDGPRPCPFTSCRHHLGTEVGANGGIKFTFQGVEPTEIEHSCVLDLAEEGPMTMEDVGRKLNMTRERVRQIEDAALRKIGRNMSPDGEIQFDPKRAMRLVSAVERRGWKKKRTPVMGEAHGWADDSLMHIDGIDEDGPISEMDFVGAGGLGEGGWN